jgi:hypothetical protein
MIKNTNFVVACDLLFTVAPESLPQLQLEHVAPPLLPRCLRQRSGPTPASLLNRAKTRFHFGPTAEEEFDAS